MLWLIKSSIGIPGIQVVITAAEPLPVLRG